MEQPKDQKNRRFLPHLHTFGAFPHSPAISIEELRLVEVYLDKDAKDHHIFFNDKGFHNHLSHMLLADFSLGATSERLHQVYKQEEKIQRPKLPKHDNFKWTEHLGDEEYYTDYFDFMTEEVKSLGSLGAIEKYAFEKEHNMLSRWVGGAYHPFIHTGYGVEFGIDGVVAEGLAEMCVHKDRMKGIVDTKSSDNTSSETALDIAKTILTDKRFEGLLTFEESPKVFKLLEKKPELVIEYAEKWSLPKTTEGLLEKARELMILGAAVYGGPQRPKKEIVLDFFLMHALTSSLFLPSVVKVLKPELAERLLKAKFAVDLAYYISRSRPELYLEQFTSTEEFTKSWHEIIDLAIKHDDEHVPKVIRALKQAERWDPEETLGKGVYRAMASMTVESILHDGEQEKDGKRWWSQDGIGFDEVWKDIPDRK